MLDTNVIVSAATNRGRPRDLLKMTTQCDEYTLAGGTYLHPQARSRYLRSDIPRYAAYPATKHMPTDLLIMFVFSATKSDAPNASIMP